MKYNIKGKVQGMKYNIKGKVQIIKYSIKGKVQGTVLSKLKGKLQFRMLIRK